MYQKNNYKLCKSRIMFDMAHICSMLFLWLIYCWSLDIKWYTHPTHMMQTNYNIIIANHLQVVYFDHILYKNTHTWVVCLDKNGVLKLLVTWLHPFHLCKISCSSLSKSQEPEFLNNISTKILIQLNVTDLVFYWTHVPNMTTFSCSCATCSRLCYAKLA